MPASKISSTIRQMRHLFGGGRSAWEGVREVLRWLLPPEWRRRGVRLLRRSGVAGWMLALSEWRTAGGTVSGRSVSEGAESRGGLIIRPELRQAEKVLQRPIAEVQRARPAVVCLSIIDWEFRFQRPQQLMRQFASHGHRVFWISLARVRRPGAEPRFSLHRLEENLFEVRLSADEPWEVHGRVLRQSEVGLALAGLADLRRAEGLEEAICFVMVPAWREVAIETRRRWGWRLIYDCMDEWENFPGIGPELVAAERELVAECDLLVVTAGRLEAKWREAGRPMVLARNATDYDFFAARCRPGPLPMRLPMDEQQPLVGYFGAIADWFDIELMEYVARERPGYTFILLGGVFGVDVEPLRRLPNVIMPGQQPWERLPEWLFHFKACLIPFRRNTITDATDPVKIYEYLSAGKPVVTVPLPEVMGYAGLLHVASTPEEFVAQLDRAVKENDPVLAEERRNLARRNSWARRYRTITDGLASASRRASVIIVTWQNLALTRLCLESVLHNTALPDYEIIVVDNHSTDGTPDYLCRMAAAHPHISIILNDENLGFARANNQGVAISTGDDLVLLNNDTIVPPGWLRRLLAHLADPAVGMVGPVTNMIWNEARIPVDYQTLAGMEEFAARRAIEYRGRWTTIGMLAMFCVALRRDVWDEIGPLDERFGIGMFEDNDYCRRLHQHGFTLRCADDSFVHHFGSAGFKRLEGDGEYDRLFDRNQRRFEEKWSRSD